LSAKRACICAKPNYSALNFAGSSALIRAAMRGRKSFNTMQHLSSDRQANYQLSTDVTQKEMAVYA
jgi:hypothetical protein